MRVRMTPESQLCACTKNVLFSNSALLDQQFLQFINKVLINYKDRWSNKAELENRNSFVMRTRMTPESHRNRNRIFTHFLGQNMSYLDRKKYPKKLSIF